MKTFKLKVEGMSCGHCVRAVTEALQTTPGVQIDQVQIGSATGRYDEASSSGAKVAETVTAAGYPATLEK